MRPLDVTAEPDERGGIIRLSWTVPPGDYKGTRVYRRESTYPDPGGADGSALLLDDPTPRPAGQAVRFVDAGNVSGSRTVPLKGKTVYYYAVVAYDSAAKLSPAYVSAMATSPYQTGADLYNNLPGVYQTFDTVTPPPSPTLDPGDRDKGQLQRLLEMFGLQFDLIRSFAAGVQDFHKPETVDGNLLPLLAQWIGWPTSYASPLAKQRREVSDAPHVWATVGVAANLRATLNRLVTWDARFKEYAHNVFLANNPEQLYISETRNPGAGIGPPQPVTLDVAHEGRPSACRTADGRPVLFYHARQSAPVPGAAARYVDRFHLWVKVFDRSAWLPARRLTWDGELNRAPAALARADGTFWLFWTDFEPPADAPTGHIRLQQVALGRGASGAAVETANPGPFALADNDALSLTVADAGGILTRSVAFHPEDFADITQARAAEVAAVLNREVPGLDAGVTEAGAVRLLTRSVGAAAKITLNASTALAKLGLSGIPPASGLDAVAARLVGGGVEPFALAVGDTLTFALDGNAPDTLTFAAADAPNLAAATAQEVAAAVNRVVPGAAAADSGRVVLLSSHPGDASMVALDVSRSTAAPKLGFAAPPRPPVAGLDDSEPAPLVDAAGDVWLFFASQRGGGWNLWYSRFAAGSWGVPKPLTAGPLPDREPSAAFDAASGRIWVFWARKKANGLWNVFSRRTTQLDFNAIVDADWTEAESTPAPADFDNREPSVVVTGADALDLYFASNRHDGWNVWHKAFSSAAQGAEGAVTDGPFTRRAPSALALNGGVVAVWLRGNESQVYNSALYPSSTTIDTRYGGSVTTDTRNPARIGLRGAYGDLLSYTHDTPRADPSQEAARLYSRDTVGIFLTPDTDDERLVVSNQDVIAQVVRRFLPIQVRTVFQVETAYVEFAYNYEGPRPAAPRFIEDQLVGP